MEVADPDGDSEEALLAGTRVVAEFLHYAGEAYHVHPYRQVSGRRAGTMAVDDVHAPGHGVIRLWAETTDASGATGAVCPGLRLLRRRGRRTLRRLTRAGVRRAGTRWRRSSTGPSSSRAWVVDAGPANRSWRA